MHEIGQRSNQEDFMYPLPGEATADDRCFVLCDGMGGHDSGEVASYAVCMAIGEYMQRFAGDNTVVTADDFRAALSAAYNELDKLDTNAVKKMGTTMTFVKFHAGGCLVAHIGDSRVYHLRPSAGILYETRDHSLVNDLIKVGELTEESAKDFAQKNVITRVMQPNTGRRCRADIKEISDVRAGDYFFMCSDGVNEVMESRHIANVILDNEISDAKKLEIIIGNTAEARDNHTAFLIHVLEVDNAPVIMDSPQVSQSGKKDVSASECKKSWTFFGIVCILLAAIALFCMYWPADNESKETACKYDYVSRFIEGIAYVQLNNNYGFINEDSVEIVPCKYELVSGFSEGMASVKLNDKWGFVNKDGIETIPCKYDRVSEFSGGKAKVLLDGEAFHINKDGERVD